MGPRTFLQHELFIEKLHRFVDLPLFEPALLMVIQDLMSYLQQI